MLAVIIFLFMVGWKTRSIGLIAAFCFQIWMFYWLGGLIHAFPWSELDEDEAVYLGLQYATYGMVAFTAGVMLAGPPLAKFLIRRASNGSPQPKDMSFGRRCILWGMCAYFILAPTIGGLPSGSAIAGVGSQLVVVGFCLQSYMAWHLKGRAAFLRTVGPAFLIPVVILAKQGFMSYGIMAVSIILCFIAQFYRPRWAIAAVLAALAYPGLSVYVSYMRDRSDIRAAVWGGEAVSDRMSRIWETFSTLETFNPKNPDHLERIDARLDQCYLIGEAVDNLSRTDDFSRGASILVAFEGMIPRLIWPDKPPSGGSGLMVSRFTGRTFAVGTSVGVGPVLEFYGNFGTPGVLIGFFILGSLIRGLDIAAATTLENGYWGHFVLFFLVGISCLNVSGSLVEVTATGTASFFVGRLIRSMLGARRTPQLSAVAA